MSTFCNYWNKVSLVKSKIKKSKKIDSIGIGLASPAEIRRWGERQLPNGTLIGKVDKDHTVDYESLKPIEGGLFCERIFGPVEDFYCSCERKGEKNEKFCPTCEVEFTKSRVRRIRMGYIPLAVPVVHVWYLRGRPSYIANLVGKSRNSIDRLAYGETLSESFIGYSSLESKSVYKKEENVFPHDTVKFNLKSNYDNKDLITSNQDTNQRKLLQNELQKNDSFSCNNTRKNFCVSERNNSYFNKRNSEETPNSEGVLLTSCVNNVSFSSSISLMSNQDFTIPKRLCYSKDFNTSNGVPLNDSSFNDSSNDSSNNSSFEASSYGRPSAYSLPLKGYGIPKELVSAVAREKIISYKSGADNANLNLQRFGCFTPCEANPLRGKEYALICKASARQLLTPLEYTKQTLYPGVRNSFEAPLVSARVIPLRPHFFYKLSWCAKQDTSSKSSICKICLPSAKLCFAKGMRSKARINPVPLTQCFTPYSFGVYEANPLPLRGTRGKELRRNSEGTPKELCQRVVSTSCVNEYTKGYKATNLQFIPFVTTEKSVAFVSVPRRGKGSEAERYPKGISFGQKQKYLKCHTLPLFSTFVYKEWAHRFSFLEYFIWSARNNDLILPFYAYQNSNSEKRLADIYESIRKSSINLVRNKFSLRFSNKNSFTRLEISPFGDPFVNKNILQKQKVQPHFLQLRNKHGVLRVIKVKKDIGFLFHTKPNFYDIHFVNNFFNNDALRRNSLPYPAGVRGEGYGTPLNKLRVGAKVLPYPLYPLASHGVRDLLCTELNDFFSCNSTYQFLRNSLPRIPQRGKGDEVCKRTCVVGNSEERFRRNCYAFSTIQQDTESTPLNKMDTQQFPRLTELLNFTGGAALRNLLSRFDLIVLSKFLRHELKNLELKVNSLLALKILTYSQGLLLGKLAKRRSKQIRRLKLLELFQSQKSNPEWMILSVIPVLPPDLRPILRVNDDFVVASDLNRLYQTVLRRNNTIHERLDDPLPCPESGLFRQRSLQKAVDGLLENGKGGGTPLCASKRRPLVSLSHVLKGKKGLFRQHLLGKRVDYSGRSVIVVGPRLQVHECGLPKEMAIELFQPFLLHRLKVKGLATSNTIARRMIQQENPIIWHLLKQLIYEHPVLLNRAPTLHRLGIQAFQPRLVSGRAILLHPLVCNGFNADFDGDQMAVHVPLSFQARAEAWKIMWSKNNFLSPATGQPILVPSQDMVLGCYYLSVSIPRILNANFSIVSHDKAVTNNTNHTYSLTQLVDTTPSEFLRSSLPLVPRRGKGSGVKQPNQKFVLPKTPNKRFDISKLEISTANQNLHSKAFLNENKGQYFSNLQDSLLAYFQGRLQTHTPFWVRIDHKFAQEKIYKSTICKASNNSSFNDSSNDSSQTPYSFGVCEANPTPLEYTKLKGVRGKEFFGNSAETLRVIGRPGAITKVDYITRANPQANSINNRFCDIKAGTSLPFLKASKEYGTLLPKVQKLLAVNEKIKKEKLNDLVEVNPNNSYFNKRNLNVQYASLMNRPNINIDNLKTLKLTFLQPLYGSSREICKTLFQNKSANNCQIRVEANETLESPLELRLSVDGNLANILTMFQNHYNYNATWVKQCKEESIKYMRTTAGRVVINDVVFKDF